MTLTAPVRRESKEWIGGQGYAMEIIDNPTSRVQWYRADGTPLPNLLPADGYHMRRFRAKGWRLTPYSEEQLEMFKDSNITMIKGEPSGEIPDAGTPEAPLYISDKDRESQEEAR